MSNRRRIAVVAAAVLVAAAAWLVFRGGETTADSRPAAHFAGYGKLSPIQRAGQRVIGGFPGRSVPSGLRRAIRRGQIGGVILFSANIGSRRQIRHLTGVLQRIPRPGPLRRAALPVMVDQEGGLVKRLAGAPRLSAAQMGAKGPAAARHQGRLTGRNLRDAGFNLDLAPVLDVARPGGTIDVTHRAFGHTAARAGRAGVAFSDGLRAGGVAATAKHFPGLGAARINTDDAVQRIRLSKRQLRRKDLKPFRRFVASGGEAVMVGNAIYPAFGRRPAAFNRRLVTGELRHRLGFTGVAITDSLDAVAARAYGGPGKAAAGAARAGMDLMLYGNWETALRGARTLSRRLQSGRLGDAAFRNSVTRIVMLRRGLR